MKGLFASLRETNSEFSSGPLCKSSTGKIFTHEKIFTPKKTLRGAAARGLPPSSPIQTSIPPIPFSPFCTTPPTSNALQTLAHNPSRLAAMPDLSTVCLPSRRNPLHRRRRRRELAGEQPPPPPSPPPRRRCLVGRGGGGGKQNPPPVATARRSPGGMPMERPSSQLRGRWRGRGRGRCPACPARAAGAGKSRPPRRRLRPRWRPRRLIHRVGRSRSTLRSGRRRRRRSACRPDAASCLS